MGPHEHFQIPLKHQFQIWAKSECIIVVEQAEDLLEFIFLNFTGITLAQKIVKMSQLLAQAQQFVY